MKNSYHQPTLFQPVAIDHFNNRRNEGISQLKIFIVDNDFFSAYLYEQHLKNLGFTDIQVYDSATTCIENLLQQPDIIFLDNDMEKTGDPELLKKIKRINPGCNVVIISDKAAIEPVVIAIKQGAFAYIIKNQSGITQINKVIERIIETRAAIKRARNKIFKVYLPFL